jgi:hypothetical protein
MYEIMTYSILCEEKFYHLLMKFFKGKYTKRCAVSRATTYRKFSLGSLALIRHSSMTLKIDDNNCVLIFCKFDPSLIKDGIQKIIEIGDFVEKKILYHLRRSAPQTIKL